MTDAHDRDDAGDDDARSDVQKAAEETSRRVQPSDPYTEPPNSTVDDWLGQRVAADMETADATGEDDPDAPGAFIDDDDADEVPEPNEPA
jgi:hypothetical protein